MTKRKSRTRTVVKQQLTLKLNTEDSVAFADALLHPPKPNDGLQKAA